MTTITPAECIRCTVGLDPGDQDGLCGFCRDYVSPAEAVTASLAEAFATASSAADNLGQLIPNLPSDTPIWAIVDLTRACGHLRAAARLVDKAAARITDAEAVVR